MPTLTSLPRQPSTLTLSASVLPPTLSTTTSTPRLPVSACTAATKSSAT